MISDIDEQAGTLPPEEPAKKELQALFYEGLLVDIFQADEGISLYKTIGMNAEGINKFNFGELFGALQGVLSDRLVLSLNKLFEVEKRNPSRSIPAVLSYLEKNSHILKINSRNTVVTGLTRIGSNLENDSNLTDTEFSRKVVEALRPLIPNHKGDSKLSKTLKALRDSRDKRIAHNEHIDSKSIAGVTWNDCIELLEFAKIFTASIGYGYMSLMIEHPEGKYMLSDDAERRSIALTRLFKKAGIIEVTHTQYNH